MRMQNIQVSPQRTQDLRTAARRVFHRSRVGFCRCIHICVSLGWSWLVNLRLNCPQVFELRARHELNVCLWLNRATEFLTRSPDGINSIIIRYLMSEMSASPQLIRIPNSSRNSSVKFPQWNLSAVIQTLKSFWASAHRNSRRLRARAFQTLNTTIKEISSLALDMKFQFSIRN
jgi:hypothetical protein